jgi:hypothetical protein
MTALWRPPRWLVTVVPLVSCVVAGFRAGLLVLALPRPGAAGKIAA